VDVQRRARPVARASRISATRFERLLLRETVSGPERVSSTALEKTFGPIQHERRQKLERFAARGGYRGLLRECLVPRSSLMKAEAIAISAHLEGMRNP